MKVGINVCPCPESKDLEIESVFRLVVVLAVRILFALKTRGAGPSVSPRVLGVLRLAGLGTLGWRYVRGRAWERRKKLGRG